ncbi:MAG: T9SS type A sorting domain-containing protein [Ignavibacteria bacterium]|nr:T9SS type A sorting domain-containing protein [Ignavibacteria bacterium]
MKLKITQVLFMLLFLCAQAGSVYSQQSGSKIDEPLTAISAVNKTAQLELADMQKAPIPFVANTIISFSIPRQEEVQLTVFDHKGKAIKTIINDVKDPGSYSAELTAANLKGGIYFYRLTIGSFSEVKKIQLGK